MAMPMNPPETGNPRRQFGRGRRCAHDVRIEAISFSHGIRRLPGLAGLLGVDAIRWHLSASTAPAAPRDLVLGWGSKRNILRARCFATDHGLTYLSLEDGFLRSVGLGTSGAGPYSLVVDDVGIYYDARRPSRLENLLNGEALADLLEAVRRACPGALSSTSLIPTWSAATVPLAGCVRVWRATTS